MRRSIAAIVALAMLCACSPENSSSKALKSLASGPRGRVEFETLTLSSGEFWNATRTGKATTISGELYLPRGDGRVPGIVMSHEGGGIGRTEETWARELRSQGVVVFLVDSYGGRGIKRFPPETELSRVGQVYDVYQALALLATHPRVDPTRIAMMGPSRGGGLTLLASMTRSSKAQMPKGVDFAAYLAFYPSILPTLDYGSLASRPIRIFTGTADEASRITTVRAFAQQQRVAGADIKVFEYEGAHHAFDNPDVREPFVVRASTASFTILYDPRAHTMAKADMQATLREIFGSI